MLAHSRQKRPFGTTRRLVVAIAVIAVVFAATTEGARRDARNQRREAFQMLLLPLMNFHAGRAAQCWSTAREAERSVRTGLIRAGENLAAAARSIGRLKLSGLNVEEVRNLVSRLRRIWIPADGEPSIRASYLESVAAWNLMAYHDHMRMFYIDQTHGDSETLQPIPAELDAELKACEAEMRLIQRNPTLDLSPESALELRPSPRRGSD